jgi:transitional endoplasmic reticulum ATPase
VSAAQVGSRWHSIAGVIRAIVLIELFGGLGMIAIHQPVRLLVLPVVFVAIVAAQIKWPKAPAGAYFHASRRAALPALAAGIGWFATSTYIETTTGDSGDALVSAALAAVCLSVLILIYQGKLLRRAFESDPGLAKAAIPAGQQDDTTAAFAFPAVRPSKTFADLYGNEDFKAALRDDGRRWQEDGKNGILLFGPPGTGKTVFAEALAAELGLGFIKVTFGNLASKWINQSTEQMLQMFKDATAQQPAMLFIDEIDALLKSRESQSGNYEEYERMVTTFLDQSVELRNAKVLLVAATNYIDKLDEAAIREGRFDFRHEVPLPDAAAREGLLREEMKGGRCTTDDATLERLVRRWAGFNVPRLMACAEGACEIGRVRQHLPTKPGKGEPSARVELAYDDFYKSLRKLQGRRGGAPEGAKALSDLFVDPDIREQLQSIVTRLVHVDEIESKGGALPKGILFSGPPGTGKTATAMALARESGWSFISRTGRQLLEAGAIQKLGREASDLRPAIVFIDEADDILGDRRVSPYKSVTNDLLMLIDGANGTLADVVWIAATNHPESMDTAATRGGRFGERIEFRAPSRQTEEALIRDWLVRKTGAKAVVIDGTADTWMGAVCDALAGLTPSDIYQALDTANGRAIAAGIQSGSSRVLSVERVREAADALRRA